MDGRREEGQTIRRQRRRRPAKSNYVLVSRSRRCAVGWVAHLLPTLARSTWFAVTWTCVLTGRRPTDRPAAAAKDTQKMPALFNLACGILQILKSQRAKYNARTLGECINIYILRYSNSVTQFNININRVCICVKSNVAVTRTETRS